MSKQKKICLNAAQLQQLLTDENYEVLDFVGSGGMACVYQVKERQTPNVYALKLLREEYLRNVRFMSIFRQEANHLRDLAYPNIVRYYRFVEHKEYAYILMDYVDGNSLSAFTRNARKTGTCLPIPAVVRIMVQVARAINYLHREGYIHRDIKADNILIQRGNGQTFLTDLGIITNKDDIDGGLIAGTPAYMPCEQQRNKAINHTIDIYSFAVVIYEMLAGRRPFTANTSMALKQARQEITRQHCEDPVPSLLRFRSDLPPELDTILQKALMKNPSQRYQDVMQMAQDIHRVLLPKLPQDLQNFEEIKPRYIAEIDDAERGTEQSWTEQLENVSEITSRTIARQSRNRRAVTIILLITLIAAAMMMMYAVTGATEETRTPTEAAIAASQIEATHTSTPVRPEATATDRPTDEPATVIPTENPTEEPITATPIMATDVPTHEPATSSPSEDTIQPSATDTAVPGDMTTLPTGTTEPATTTPVPPSATATSIPTETMTMTTVPTHTLVPTVAATATPYLNGEDWIPIIEGVDAFGIEDNLASAVRLAQQEFGNLIPLRFGQVNGFGIILGLDEQALDRVERYGVVFRLQDAKNYALFTVNLQKNTWQLQEIHDGVAETITSDLLSGNQLVNRLMVSGIDNFFRFEMPDEIIQHQQDLGENGSVGLWVEMIDDSTFPLASIQLGLLGEDARQASENFPTPAPPILQWQSLLLNDLLAWQEVEGSTAFSIDCEAYIRIYMQFEPYSEQAETAAFVQELKNIGSLIKSQCEGEGTTEIELSVSDYLNWENSVMAIITRLNVQN